MDNGSPVVSSVVVVGSSESKSGDRPDNKSPTLSQHARTSFENIAIFAKRGRLYAVPARLNGENVAVLCIDAHGDEDDEAVLLPIGQLFEKSFDTNLLDFSALMED